MGQYEKDKAELLEKIEKLEHKDNARHDLKYHELMDALHRELRRKRMSQKPQLSSSQRFDLRDRVFCLTDGFVPNGNANLGRPPASPATARTASTGRPWAA